MKKTRSKGVVKVFSDVYNAIDKSVILGIHRYLMKKEYKIMLGFIEKVLLDYKLAKLMLLMIQNVHHYNAWLKLLINWHPN